MAAIDLTPSSPMTFTVNLIRLANRLDIANNLAVHIIALYIQTTTNRTLIDFLNTTGALYAVSVCHAGCACYKAANANRQTKIRGNHRRSAVG